MKLLEQLVQKYDAASVFVVAATLVVVIELMVMRVLVPVASNTENQETDALMAQVYGDTSQAETMKEIEAWQHEALILTQRLPNTSELWQKDLESIHAFGTEQVEMATTPKASNEKGKQSEAMEYAASKLILQSVMSGRTPLANINGKIYRVGDTVVLRDGDIVTQIIEIGKDYAVIELVGVTEGPPPKRTIYVTQNARMSSGVQ